MAAMSMGVSTMRRRPLRTVLTAVTILLLTFTILCFASFGTELGVIRLRLGPPTPYAGAMLHGVNWEILDTHLLEVLRGRWPDAVVCPRYWLTRDNDDEPQWALTRRDGTRPAPLLGVLGMDATEARSRPDLAELLGKPSASGVPRIWISRAMASQLGVAPGEQVLLGGKPLEVGPLLDSAQLDPAGHGREQHRAGGFPAAAQQSAAADAGSDAGAAQGKLVRAPGGLDGDHFVRNLAGPRRDAAGGAPLCGGRRQSRRYRR